ncbi:cobalt chelatase [Paraburkholderia sp. SARCC-3016]|uniref:cobaltochelatase CobT-related protein n=1 Tax=Paraburkholderia sp. SARCC-3016 TaxID=3058611 RepID=UPI0028081809|nr:cobalt chelatase [Paraburkholderia sp. SARCC-3016]MDQ7977326.1 cobalt chelatase [Paraburkholderia sp. SARCC-3016]
MSEPERAALQRAARADALRATTVRAITGDAALHYSGGRLCRNMTPLPFHAPHLRITRDEQAAASSAAPSVGSSVGSSVASFRGAADGAALRALHSDTEWHRQHMPVDPVERLLFESLEQLRCESLLPPGMPGLAHNLRVRFDTWSHGVHLSGLIDGEAGLLLYTVAQMCWSRLSGWPVLEETEGLIEATRAFVAPVIGVPLANMRRTRHDQQAFAVHALELARQVSAVIDAQRAAAGLDDDDTQNRQKEEATRNAFSLFLEFEDGDDEGIALADTGESRVLRASEHGYRVFTNRYDREAYAASFVRQALLAEYRERLDERIRAQPINVARLARMLKAALAVPERDGWSFGEESGRIDGRRLAQLVSSPAERRLFRLERHTPISGSIVGFLIDCSGSMRARIEPVAMLVDVLARALDGAGIANEILGFTTGAWNGGRARSDWLAHGRPEHPGRLNEVLNLVFKDADTSWRRARADIAALLKGDLFREGVDGEAVEWACNRMRAHAANRRVLIVISDGSPMDAATHHANDAYYLDNHLKQVVAEQRAYGDVDVLGLGVGLDLSPYYRYSLAVDLSAAPDMALFSEVARWIGKPAAA